VHALLVLSLLWPAAAARAQTADPAAVGRWGPLQTWPASLTHAHLLPTGKVLVFGEFDQGHDAPLLFDPATGALGRAAHADYNVFCAGHSFLPDGRLLVTGGHVHSHVGESEARIYDPWADAWSPVPDMNDRRWYPTNTTLGTGEVLVLSGETTDSGVINELPQVFSAETNGWRDLTTARLKLPYYPRTFLAPNGRVVLTGPAQRTRWLDTAGTGTWLDLGPRLSGGRSYGPAVLLDGKALLVGGGDPPLATTEVLDLTLPSPRWAWGAPMAAARRQHNATLLPDGTVFVNGGSSATGFDEEGGAVLTPEAYDPATDTWARWAPNARYRGYHSASLLLPDGRVLTGGGRHDTTVEVFSPPYLFRGPRPAVTDAPARVHPGGTFHVATPDGADVRKVTLLAPGSVTHAFDQHARLLTLPFTPAAGGGLEVTAPASNDAAPAGPYLLFLVNAQGVPSVGRWVQLASAPPRLRKVVALSDAWRYDDRGVDPGPAWTQLAFDDAGWKSGQGQLGYGEGDEVTRLVASPVQPSYYFRRRFTLAHPVSAAALEALYDDGIAVWVNGVLLFQRETGKGLSHGATASASTDNAFVRAELPLAPANPFRVGENVVAVMVKQVGLTSNDLSFALQLEVAEEREAPPPEEDAVALLSPNGGEMLTAGGTATVRWSTQGAARATVDLAFSADGGVTWEPLATGVPNTGSHAWTVPARPTVHGRVRVSSAQAPAVEDASDADFHVMAAPTRQRLVAYGDTWRFLDTNVAPPATWTSPAFDDGAWRSGPGQLGYGESDQRTTLTRTSPSQPTVYFRRKVRLEGPVHTATLRALYDDGVAVFVNGTPVFSRNVGRGLAHAAYASASADNAEDEAVLHLSPNPFVVGDNVIAVMVKQVGGTSPDLSFDLQLDVETHGGGMPGH
jgi:hypothetical protein